MQNIVEFKVWGNYALFTDPITKIGGEKCSYQIPTYQALKGILESVYWKPTIVWIVDKVRIMKKIRTQARSTKPIIYSSNGKVNHSLSIYTYLYDVEYQVQAHFEWNHMRPDLEQDRNENKHYFIARRMMEKGGRRDVFLGARECQGYVLPCDFGQEQGYYDNHEQMFDFMFHGFDYPSEVGENKLCARFWRPEMKNGVISFLRPDDATLLRRNIKPMAAEKIPTSGLKANALGLLEGFEEEGMPL